MHNSHAYCNQIFIYLHSSEDSSILNITTRTFAVHENYEQHKSFFALTNIEEGEPVALFKKTMIIQLFHKNRGSSTLIFVDNCISNGIKGCGHSFEIFESQRFCDSVQSKVFFSHHYILNMFSTKFTTCCLGAWESSGEENNNLSPLISAEKLELNKYIKLPCSRLANITTALQLIEIINIFS